MDIRTTHSGGIKISHHGRVVSSLAFVGEWNQSCTLIIVHQCYIRSDRTRLKKYCPICTSEIAKLNGRDSSTNLRSPPSFQVISRVSIAACLRSTCYVWYPQISRDYEITMGRDPESVLARKKRFLFPHERLTAKQGTKKTDVCRDFCCENTTGLFCQR